MNILYCGDANIEDGLVISVLSLARQAKHPLCVYVMTMELDAEGKHYAAVPRRCTDFLDAYVREKNDESFVKRLDVTEQFKRELPQKNMDTRFTPYCMLRLFADEVAELPEKILYLDTDVICRRDCLEFYGQDISGVEFVGVLDYYGSWFFRKKWYRRDYMNSGVLLFNLQKIRETGLFEKCRKHCREKKMFLPDQSALNRLAVAKRIAPRCYNEQRRLRDDTVMQHFTTGFRLFPWLHTLTVKPWQVEKMHKVLKLYEYDDVLDEYQRIRRDVLT